MRSTNIATTKKNVFNRQYSISTNQENVPKQASPESVLSFHSMLVPKSELKATIRNKLNSNKRSQIQNIKKGNIRSNDAYSQ
jgi:hypothetical protein